MTKVVTYFGYGANAHPDMMKEMVGRMPEGQPATLRDYELIVQQAHEIPQEVQEILAGSWTPEELSVFETYAIRPQPGEKVEAWAWKLTPKERAYVDEWEMNDGLWYRKTDVAIAVGGLVVPATTEIIDDPLLARAIDLRPDLPAFLNNKERMLEVARQTRADLDARSGQ